MLFDVGCASVDVPSNLANANCPASSRCSWPRKKLTLWVSSACRIVATVLGSRLPPSWTPRRPGGHLAASTQAICQTHHLDRLKTRQPGPPTTPAKAIPGLGNFLIKVGGRTGIPIPVDRTPVEWALNDTNKQWRDAD
jgi:hypothetical protein